MKPWSQLSSLISFKEIMSVLEIPKRLLAAIGFSIFAEKK